MADFCWDCTEALGANGVMNDFYKADNLDIPRDAVSQVLCEGCGGFIIVDIYGKRISEVQS